MSSNDTPNKEQAAEAMSQENLELKKLESIREILFGQNIEEYRKEFEEIRQILKDDHDRTTEQINQLTEDFNAKLQASEEKILSKLEALDQSLQAQIDALNEAKTDRKKLADLFAHLSKELG